MTNAKHLELLRPVAKRAWKRLESEFPEWTAHLGTRDFELEFAVPAPTGSRAGHLVAFTQEDQLWIRFSPPNLCYPVDDESEMVSLIRQLTTDQVVFRVITQGDEWIETTLVKREDERETVPGHAVHFVSWSGMSDANC